MTTENTSVNLIKD